MFSGDTAYQISQAPVRASSAKNYQFLDAKKHTICDGVVSSVGPIENFEASAVVYIRGYNEYVKVENVYAGFSSANGVGSFRPLHKGDRVLIAFLYGNSSRPQIVGRLSENSSLFQYLRLDGQPIPQPGSTYNGTPLSPLPISVLPEATKFGGMVSVDVYGVVL